MKFHQSARADEMQRALLHLLLILRLQVKPANLARQMARFLEAFIHQMRNE